jgi:predicted XRE-type DNA-binding protein
MNAQTFANVWDALKDSPEDAATMTMRSNVMTIVNATVRGWNTTQAQAARRLSITQPRLNDLLKGKISRFSLDTLLTVGDAGRAQGQDRCSGGRVTGERGGISVQRVGWVERFLFVWAARQDQECQAASAYTPMISR